MRNIQLLLLAMFAVGTVLHFRRTKSRLVDRIFVLVFVLAGVVMVSFPETSDWLANILGVGRGVDAVIYFMLVFLSYACLQLYAKIRSQEGRLVELARFIAISNAKMPEGLEDVLPDVLKISEARKLLDPTWSGPLVAEADGDYQPLAKAG